MRRLARPVLYVGTAGVVLALAKLHARYVGHYVLHSTDPSRLSWTLGYIGLLVLAAYGAGLPELPRTRRQAITSALAAPLAAASTISLVQLVAGDALLPRFVVFGSGLAVIPLSLMCVAIAQAGRAQGERRDRIVLVGSRSEAAGLGVELEANPELPAVLLTALEVTEARSSSPRSRPLLEQVLNIGGTVVVLDRDAMSDPSVVSQAAGLHEAGLRVRTLSLFYEEWLGKLPVSELERASLLFDIREVHGARYLRVKRLVDLFAALVGSMALILVIPVVWIGDELANRGPLFYRQSRVGKNGEIFEIVKLRTMRPTADGSPTQWTREGDPRITPFGGLLRRTHLDELPQVLNLLKGDLSLVGPRPEQPHYVEELSSKLPFYTMRHLVQPGITGWAQVKYGYAGDERDALEKLQYEFWYLRKQSLGLDIRIIGRTVRSVLGREGKGR